MTQCDISEHLHAKDFFFLVLHLVTKLDSCAAFLDLYSSQNKKYGIYNAVERHFSILYTVYTVYTVFFALQKRC